MSDLKRGSPTGMLNETGTMMEIYMYRELGGHHIAMGKRWVPITEEVRARILDSRPKAVSMAAVVMTDELSSSLYDIDLSGRVTKHSDVPKKAPAAVTLSADEKLLRARAVHPGSFLPPGVTMTPPQDLREDAAELDAADAAEIQVTHEEDEAFAAIWSASERPVVAEQPKTDGNPRPDGIYRYSVESIPETQQMEITGTTTITHLLKKMNERDPEHSGRNVNYYSVRIDKPKRPEREPYTFEVEDLIQALNLSFHEGTILKSLIRSATERELGLTKRGGDSVRDAEKMIHSATEHLRILKIKKEKQ